MTESEARDALLVRAFETAPPAPPWDADDRDWATRSAAQIEGEKASLAAFVARRAGLAAERLARREPAVARARSALHWRPWVAMLLVAAALAVGLLVDAVSADQRINVLAPPILAILVWNAIVYLLMVGRLLGSARPRTAGTDPSAAVRSAGDRPGWLATLVARLAAGRLAGANRREPERDRAGMRTPLAAFTGQWVVASSALNGQRALAVLHAAAAALAFGALAGLYLRGLAFEFRAGWESTFLDVPSVATLLGIVLGPASALTGIALPDEARLAAIRFPAGTGENAAGWIHLYAVTVMIAVVLPRAVLAMMAALKARRLSSTFPIPLDDAYFRNLQRQHRGDAAVVHAMPYSYQPPVDSLRGLTRLMQQIFGPDTVVAAAPPVALGGEDRLEEAARAARPAHAGHAALTIALFTLSATPEVENHAAFVKALARSLPRDAAMAILVDETAFRARFGADSARLASRRAAWRKIMHAGSDIDPVFVALGDDNLNDARQALTEVLNEISGRLVQNARFAADAQASA